MDFTTMTDEQLEQHRIEVVAEQERRYRLASIPEQVATLRAQYVQDGGDPTTIQLTV